MKPEYQKYFIMQHLWRSTEGLPHLEQSAQREKLAKLVNADIERILEKYRNVNVCLYKDRRGYCYCMRAQETIEFSQKDYKIFKQSCDVQTALRYVLPQEIENAFQ